AVGGVIHLEAAAFEVFAHHLRDVAVVLDDEDESGLFRRSHCCPCCLQLCETCRMDGRSRVKATLYAPSGTAAMPFDRLLTPLLLACSNVFMTFAWYGHLKHKDVSLPKVILASWGIAFFEYLLMIPANRMGSAVYSAPQLKGMQEVITLLVFAGFSVWYLGE